MKMHTTEKTSSRSILVWSVPIVLAHFLVVIWHLVLLVKVQAQTPAFLPPLLIFINLFPLAALLVCVKGYYKLAGIMIIIPFGIALFIGSYAHFLSSGPDNIFHMAPGALIFPYRISTLLLAILEASGLWVAVRMFGNTSIEPALTS
jgi:hypothetical protein